MFACKNSAMIFRVFHDYKTLRLVDWLNLIAYYGQDKELQDLHLTIENLSRQRNNIAKGGIHDAHTTIASPSHCNEKGFNV